MSDELAHYRLTARLDGRRRRTTITEPVDGGYFDKLPVDARATMSAIAKIMNKATRDEVWARGRIELTRLSDGVVIHTMDEKGADE
jgi:hypothetical protein